MKIKDLKPFSFAKKNVLSAAFLTVASFTWGQNFESSHLPIVVINTNGITIQDEPKQMVDMGIIDKPNGLNFLTDSFNDYDGKVGIEFRGNSTQLFDKKSYSIELWDEDGNDIDASLLGMPEEEDWILYGSPIDKSHLRNVMTFELWRKMGYWASRTRYVELVIDEEYRGIYVLMEKVKRDKNRLNIAKLRDIDIEGDELTGGYIIKLDWWEEEGWWSKYGTMEGNELFYQFYYPKSELIQPAQKLYIRQYINRFEDALFDVNFINNNGERYSDLIDLQSFVDLFIINELSRSVDAYKISSFIHKEKDSEGGLLNAGPIWDFNLAYGNTIYCGATKTSGWTYLQNAPGCDDLFLMPLWWERLMSDCDFQDSLKLRWQSLRNDFLNEDFLFDFIDQQVDVLADAIDRNFDRWEYLGENLWDEPEPILDTYQEEVQLLKDWLTNRMAWMDGQLIGDCVPPEIIDTDPTIKIYPNPSNAQVTVRFYGKINVTLRLYDSVGRLISEVPHQNNEYIIEDFGKLPNGLYHLEISNGAFIHIEKMIKQE